MSISRTFLSLTNASDAAVSKNLRTSSQNNYIAASSSSQVCEYSPKHKIITLFLDHLAYFFGSLRLRTGFVWYFSLKIHFVGEGHRFFFFHIFLSLRTLDALVNYLLSFSIMYSYIYLYYLMKIFVSCIYLSAYRFCTDNIFDYMNTMLKVWVHSNDYE